MWRQRTRDQQHLLKPPRLGHRPRADQVPVVDRIEAAPEAQRPHARPTPARPRNLCKSRLANLPDSPLSHNLRRHGTDPAAGGRTRCTTDAMAGPGWNWVQQTTTASVRCATNPLDADT